MRRALSTKYRLAGLVVSIFLALSIAGCEGDDGAAGADGADGVAGAPGAGGADGANGVACWDLNGNGAGDPDEDLNGDGIFDALDCNAIASGASRPSNCTPATSRKMNTPARMTALTATA